MGIYEPPTADAAPSDPDAATSTVIDAQTLDGSSDPACPWIDALPAQAPPTIWLVVELTDVTAFQQQAMRQYLFTSGPDNALEPIAQSARLGAIFHGTNYDAASCPELRVISPAFQNFAAISAGFVVPATGMLKWPMTSYAFAWIDEAVRADAALARSSSVILVRTSVLSVASSCTADLPPPPAGEAQTTNETYGMTLLRTKIADLAARGILTYVFEPSGFNVTDGLGEELARLGGTDTPYFDDAFYGAQVQDAFREVVRSTVSCELPINGTVALEDACRGRVNLADEVVPCDANNGFRLRDTHTIELMGTACSRLRDDPQLRVRAEFPCDVILR